MRFDRRELRYLRYDVEERFERFLRRAREVSCRKSLGIATCGAGGCLIVAMFVLVCRGPWAPGRERTSAWFYDLNTRKLFVSGAEQVPPIEAPSGPLADGGCAGVKAYVMAYGEEPNESEIRIAFLEKVDPEARAAVGEMLYSGGKVSAESIRYWNESRLICRPQDSGWYRTDTAEGKAILAEVFRPDSKGRIPHYYAPR